MQKLLLVHKCNKGLKTKTFGDKKSHRVGRFHFFNANSHPSSLNFCLIGCMEVQGGRRGQKTCLYF